LRNQIDLTPVDAAALVDHLKIADLALAGPKGVGFLIATWDYCGLRGRFNPGSSPLPISVFLL
jgi:hypothetical protein